MRVRKRCAAVVGAVALLVAGCGSDGGGDKSSGKDTKAGAHSGKDPGGSGSSGSGSSDKGGGDCGKATGDAAVLCAAKSAKQVEVEAAVVKDVFVQGYNGRDDKRLNSRVPCDASGVSACTSGPKPGETITIVCAQGDPRTRDFGFVLTDAWLLRPDEVDRWTSGRDSRPVGFIPMAAVENGQEVDQTLKARLKEAQPDGGTFINSCDNIGLIHDRYHHDRHYRN